MSAPYSRLNPFRATLVENRVLSGAGSAKEVRHIVFNLEGSELSYRVGQSLGVYSTNSEADVCALLQASALGESDLVTLPKLSPMPLREALTRELFLGAPTKKILELLKNSASGSDQALLTHLLSPESAAEVEAFLAERFIVDLFEEFPSVCGKVSAQALVECMKKLQPRLYSIASSPKVAGSCVELTVGIVRYTTNGRKRGGVCSTFLADRLELNGTAPVFVGESPFKITDDDTAPVIMVGPGTGIAPFRAFLQERMARQASGQNWLFFGDQHRKSDFLYEDEFSSWVKQGALTHLSLAWSRDQEKKVYVQDLIRESAKELWDWLQSGAYFYVCGDAKRMAKDVDAALQEVVATQGGLDATQTVEYVSQLKKSGRYMRDVY